MNPESENLSTQESIDLITSMINQAKGNARKNSFYFLLWGWTVLFCNVSLYIMMKFLDMEHPFWIWSLTIPAAIASALYGRYQGRAEFTTHLDNIIKWLWIGYGLLCFTIVIFGHKINFMINPMIVCMSALPTLVSGVILKFRPLIIGGICFWVCGITLFFLPVAEQFLIAAIAIMIGYLVPGYILRSKKA